MMGKSHLLVGGAAWMASAPLLAKAGVSLTPAELGAGAVVTSGASMLPDLDHPKATVSNSLGIITKALSKFLNTSMGGHRNGTHSLLFAALATFLTAMLLLKTDGPYAEICVTFFFTSLVFRTLTEASGFICAGLSLITSATLITLAPQAEWLYVSVGVGCLAHMLGDILTPQGVPAFWPLSKSRQKFPVIGHTGDWREGIIAGLCGLAALYLIISAIFVPIWEKRGDFDEGAKKQEQTQIKKEKNAGPNILY